MFEVHSMAVSSLPLTSPSIMSYIDIKKHRRYSVNTEMCWGFPNSRKGHRSLQLGPTVAYVKI